ncbi:putative RING-H2 finger protein ATL19 [Senna tora]|uniref:Putative RING-H2 finger protein ATL19 n=1 Tax=Senna tora TaxID=362788 RepID=A0A834TRV8_9FABA|nr:putative RING-H2 finger protein ATL19 [Senna tora]
MNNMGVEIHDHDSADGSHEYTITLDIPTCILIGFSLTLFFCILYHILYTFFYCFLGTRIHYYYHQRHGDIEEGMSMITPSASSSSSSSLSSSSSSINYGGEDASHVAMFQAVVRSNLQAWMMVGALMGESENAVEEKRGERLRDSKKMGGLVKYGGEEEEEDYCAICLEELKGGEWCQVFPVCDHVFHSDCIDSCENDNGGIPPRRTEAPPPPFPPRLPCIVAIGIVSLIFVGAILTLFTVAAGVLIFAGCVCCFGGSDDDDGGEFEMDVETGGGSSDELDEERAVEILEGFLRVVRRRGRGGGGRKQRKKKNESRKKVVGSIESFGSEGMRGLDYSECSICLEEFQGGENCLVFPVCGHVFHCKCILRWIEKKLTCPVCRYCVVLKASRDRGM